MPCPAAVRPPAAKWLCVLLLTILPMRGAAAQDAPKAPAAQPPAGDDVAPTLVMSASVASVDKVAAFAKELGLGDLPFLSTRFIEERMPFIGAGGLAPDRPLGVLFYVGRDLNLERSATFVFPVNPGKAELKTFMDRGGQPIEGRTDMIKLEAFAFRRAKEQFVFGQVTDAVAAVREDVLTSAYANDGAAVDSPIARVDIDIAAVKKAIPEKYEAFFADATEGIDATDTAGQGGASFAISLMREVTRLSLSLAHSSNGGLKLGLTGEPFTAPKEALAKVLRPGLPIDSTLFRADIAQPPAKAFARVTDGITKLVEIDRDFAILDPKQQEQVKAFAANVAHFLLAGDAGTMGVERVKDHFIVDWITPRGGPAAAVPNLETEMKDLAAQAKKLATLVKQSQPILSYSSYSTATGEKVHRLALVESAKTEVYLDAVARDRTVLMTLSATDGTFVEQLIPLKDGAEMPGLVSGWLEPSAVLDSIGLLDEKKLADLKATIKGQHVDWTASPENGAIRVEVIVPKSILQNLPKTLPLSQ